jgi:hypothetical protein
LSASVPPNELDKLVATLLARVGSPGQPPLRLLVPLARHLGADGVLPAKPGAGTEDGFLEVMGDQLLIRIRQDRHRTRQRFTLAHEIGHLVLSQPDLFLTPMRRRSGLEDDERFCDVFAAALLMPRDWMKRRYTESPHSLSTLMDCSASTETSLPASLLRLRALLGWSNSLLHWRRTDRRWRLVGTTGVPAKLRFKLSTTSKAHSLLDGLEPNCSIQLKMPLGGVDGLIQSSVEIRAKRASVIGLVDLREAKRRFDELGPKRMAA